jgi:phage recombination protein Bet
MNVPVRITDYTGAQLLLIRKTVAKDTNADEFDLFMAVARMKRLDPFSKQISAIVFNKGDEARRQMAIIVTIDGMRSIAARSGRYRPDEDEAQYFFDEALKGPANPLGIERATVTIYIADPQKVDGWRPVKGWAYWSEFAPIKEDFEGGFAWEDTGETWPDSGKAKKRKVPRTAGAQVVQTLDTSGNWGRMPRVMIAKCAEAQALRKAFPEDLSGIYEGAELDRAQVLEITASEAIGEHMAEERLRKAGALGGIMFQLSPTSSLETIPVGQVADKVLEVVRDFGRPTLDWFESANVQPLREFWAKAPADALGLKSELEKIRSGLPRE